MIKQRPWENEYNQELERAIRARTDGNDGMVRVCARRAAGIVIGEYLRLHRVKGITTSAYARLALFITLPDVDAKCKEVTKHFLIKVNHDHNMPVDADLLSDVIWLKQQLLDNNTVDYAHFSDHQQ